MVSSSNLSCTCMDFSTVKIAVITALAGSKEKSLHDPVLGAFPDVDYFAFVDRVHNCQVWKQLPLWNFSNDNVWKDRRSAKLPKVLGWLLVPGYDYYIWHDCICDVVVHPRQIIENFLYQNDLALFRHPDRKCSYAEADIIAQRKLDDLERVSQTQQFLRNQGWGANRGLFELSSFVYKNSQNVQTAFLSWWELIEKYSSRDQLVFPYIVDKYKLTWNYLPGTAMAYAGNNQIIPQVR